MRKAGVGFCFAFVFATAYIVHGQTPSGGLDPAAVQELLTKFNVPGVSIAVIKDFKIEWARGYGIADVETGAPGHSPTRCFRPRGSASLSQRWFR